MASFYVYDIVFLVLFTLFVVWFLFTRKTGLKREGILYLYRTSWGIKLIHRLGAKHKKLFGVLDWLSIICGYILMIIGIWFVWKLVDVYIIQVILTGTTPLKVFPLLPVIPYTPELFKLSFLPPFYFTYWIVSLAIIAIGHEFSHGIFASAKGIKIKATGFGFLGPFIAAFVEPDEKRMQKLSNKKQMAILSAGTFANIIMTIFFFIIFILFFLAVFAPSGYIFSTYSYSMVPANGMGNLTNYSSPLGNFSQITVDNKTYFIDSNLSKIQNASYVYAFDDTPAFRAGLVGAIIQIDDMKINGRNDLQNFLSTTKSGQNITITTINTDGKNNIYNITLANNPNNSTTGYIGIGSTKAQTKGIVSSVMNWMVSFIDSSTYYSPRIDKNLAIFIKDLFFWIIMLNLSVAIVNMIPLGIFDGGRVFYLTILSITKSEKFAKKTFSIVTYFILSLVLLMVVLWFFAVK